jgi:hypothetical protein
VLYHHMPAEGFGDIVTCHYRRFGAEYGNHDFISQPFLKRKLNHYSIDFPENSITPLYKTEPQLLDTGYIWEEGTL